MKKLLFPSWTCTKCGYRHFVMPNPNKVCFNLAECTDRIKENSADFWERYRRRYSKKVH